jgi:hypothetical protein
VAKPSDRQLEKHIKQSAQDSARVIFTKHARLRMRQRYVNDPMVLEVLRLGSFALPPEPDIKNPDSFVECTGLSRACRSPWSFTWNTQPLIWS